eukprot:CAMPEP_0195530634 /NCGR_PEP_ID=MMETSP0794_2-20130614/33599_1 /TAXON_ID=515487 /ORGANISM="Stephanopyxis turris, Strain CCMP 815" /LENGTH=676 /DNA_ID=CAMNT_0040662185 /DNA_START=273 /DNA_END=2303 /DNA_ORIENTATION=+
MGKRKLDISDLSEQEDLLSASISDDDANSSEVDETATEIIGEDTLANCNNIYLDEISSISEEVNGDVEEVDPEAIRDSEFMNKAIELVKSSDLERGAPFAPFPRPVGAALVVSEDGRVIGSGITTCNQDCVVAALSSAGVEATPLREWCVTWTADRKKREEIHGATLYTTLEPSSEHNGESLPPITQLIECSGVKRVVIGCRDPVTEHGSLGAAAIHAAGLSVSMGIENEACEDLIKEYSDLANTKLQKFARNHLKAHKRPLGFLHCSVIDSDDAKAFASNGNAFGIDMGGGKVLSERDFGAYELAPPPESIWAQAVEEEYDERDVDYDADTFFEDENEMQSLSRNPMMPWYEQVDAVVATFPKKGNGPSDDDSIQSRLNGLKWLATHGRVLPAGVERILVLDANDLSDLPLLNNDPNLPSGVDVESFWKGEGRKPTKILLRHASNAIAEAAARSAANAAEDAAEASLRAKEAIESGDAEAAAEAAIACQQAAIASMQSIQREMETMQDLRRALTTQGVIVEAIKGADPIDVMNHLGKRNGYKAVVWRAGCWGSRGVDSIVAGAFQWVSAHLAVVAVGGRFWQLMTAERAVQGACGPESKVKVFSEQEDISLEYCDDKNADQDCVMSVGGRPIRHVRLDCRVALMDNSRPIELVHAETEPIKKWMGSKKEEAPWFL